MRAAVAGAIAREAADAEDAEIPRRRLDARLAALGLAAQLQAA